MPLLLSLLRIREQFELYLYTPSLAAAVIFIILFLATTGFHIYQAGKKRAYFFIPLIVGGVFEVAGYVGRGLGHDDTTNMAIFIMSTVTLLVAPALFSASIYMILGRVINFSNGVKLSPIRPSWMTKIFVCGDVASFLIQCMGGGMVAKASTANTGKNIILLGLGLQIIFFVIFVVTCVIFHVRAVSSNGSVGIRPTRIWQKYIFTLYISGTLILVRSVFRMIEFSAGRGSVLQKSEAFLYVFDGILMFGTMVCFNVVHPGDIIGGKARMDDMMLTSGDEASDVRVNMGGRK